MRAAKLRHYYANKEQYLERNRATKRRNQEFIVRAKSRPCLDCGIQYKPWIMQFDHRPGEIKLLNVSQARSRSLKTIKAEIAKCDVVCANCHADRTYKRSH
jgi:hypothetical protein